MKAFSHIYIEENIKEHPRTLSILAKVKTSKKILIKDYKEIFCRPSQDFLLQKQRPSLIIAKKKGKFVYPLPEVCQDFGVKQSYYASPVLNCIYNCSYCFLQGMYPSAYIVAFVNQEDFFDEVKSLLQDTPINLSISYDTDLLATENIFGFAKEWIEFAHKNTELLLEIRTKSSNYRAISGLTPAKNVILAWTLSPEEIISRFEKNTPSLVARIGSIQSAIKDGWKIRLCFDPIFDIENVEEIYRNFFQTVFKEIPQEKIYDAGVGLFRMNEGYFKKAKRLMPSKEIFLYPYSLIDGVISYNTEARERLTEIIEKEIFSYMCREKVFFWK